MQTVDVNLVTYNHEKFIAQAIESVLAQQVDFSVRLIIGDDCSSDNTQSIVRSYAERYPDRIHPVLETVHRGINHQERIGIKLLTLSTAKYIALLDGDDYWTDPCKLQKQVDFLESHPDTALCFHNVEKFFEDGSGPPEPMYLANQKQVSELQDLLATGTFPMPCSVLFKNQNWKNLPDDFYKVVNADWMMFVMLAEQGKIGYLNEVMAAYRVHRGGTWSRLDYMAGRQAQIDSYDSLNSYLNFKYDSVISKRIAELRRSTTGSEHTARKSLDQYHALLERGEFTKAMQMLWRALRASPAEVLRPRRLGAVVKNGLSGVVSKRKA